MKQSYPLSQSQLGIFIECQNEPELTSYNIGCRLTLPESIDLTRLQNAVQRIIAARPVLRTRFFYDDEGNPRQCVDEGMDIPVPSLAMTEEELTHYVEELFMRPFDMTGGEPLCRFAIVETEKGGSLLYCLHHVISDGTTVFTLFPKRDLPDAYAGKPLAAEGKTQTDVALEDAELTLSDRFREAQAYYKEKFADAESTELSTATGAHTGDTLIVKERVAKEDIDEWSRQRHLRPNNLLQAAFTLVLSRLGRKRKVTYTSVRHGRDDKALLNAYGMFVKTVPVLVDVSQEMTVKEFVGAVAGEWKSTHRMADYSFTAFCNDTQLAPAVTFAYQGEGMVREYELNGEMMEMEMLHRNCSARNLTCFIFCRSNHYEISIESNSALFSETDLLRFARTVKTCLGEMMKQDDRPLKDIALVTAAERQQLTAMGTGRTLDYDRSETLVSLFRKQAEATPDAVAVVFREQRYTYRQIDRMTDCLAVLLQQRYGVGGEAAVGVMIDRSEWMVIYPLAVMKAGGVYMPLDSHFPEERLQYMIADASVRLILSEGTLAEETVPGFDGDVLTREEAETLLGTVNEESAMTADGKLTADSTVTENGRQLTAQQPQPGNAFIILYTSGSTGRPKGCVLEHHSIVNYCHAYADIFGLTAADRSVAYANFGFDAHMMDIYPLLTVGGSVYILPSDMRMDLAAVHQYMEENAVTASFFTTQIGAQMASLFTFKHLRFMCVGGEKIVPVKKPSFRFYNVYGPTECTIICTCYQVRHDDEDAPIGGPVPGYQLFVMDESMHMVPQGAAGELCIAGEGVGREYLNNPAMTEEKFVTVDGVRMYRTGDLVRWSDDGNIIYLRRMDNQVKLRGLRIEIGEIETVLSRYEGIDTSAVAVQEVNGVQMLCAYYTATQDISETDLKHFLGESLTDFMVPEIYVRMDTLPLTPNGKVNRRILPLPAVEKGEIIAPATERERQLFGIVAKQLGTEDFGVTTNLITMGLTSIGAIKLAVTIQKLTGVTLRTKDVMREPDIRHWAMLMDGGAAVEQEEMHAYPAQERYPLTPNQLGVYIDWEQNRDSLQYNIPTLLRYEHISATKLADSLRAVINAHAYMKMHLERHDGEVMQTRRDAAEPVVTLHELQEEPAEEFFQQCVRPFDILKDDLYRMDVYTHGDTTWLLMDVHHIAFDGGSLGVFRRDLQTAYEGGTLEQEPFTAYDYALYNKEWQQSGAYTNAEQHFAGVMEGAEAVQYPLSLSGQKRQGLQKTSVDVPRKALRACAQRLGVTESSFFMTAVMQVLHRFTREHDIMVTTISNGRSSAVMGGSVGMFVQTLPVVSRYAAASVADTVRQMHRQMLAVMDCDKYPFTKIVEDYGVRPQIMVAYQGDVLEKTPCLDNSEGVEGRLRLETVKLPVNINIWHRSEERIEMVLEYDSSVYTEEDIRVFGLSIRAMAEGMAEADAQAPVTSLPVVSAEEERRLTALGRGRHVDMDITKTFAQLFTEQAQRTPDSLAVADRDSQLTYAQMDHRSNLLAHRFRALGIMPDDLVCVMLERTKEFPLTVLALHKAGAAYVPLDFEYPNARLSFMLENSESKLLITTRDVLEAKTAEGEFDMAAATPFFLDDVLAEADMDEQAAKAEPIDLSRPEGVAYMIYTSGSTGTPKGARLHQAGLRNFIAAVIDMERLTAADRISGHRSFSFDAHIEDMYPVLTLGGSFHVMPSEIRKDLGAIRQFLFDHQITGGGYSTAVTCLLLNTFDDLPVRFITGGGEKMAGVYSDHIEIINVYGPTECTDDTSFYAIKPGAHIEEIPIGESIANCWNFIVDEAGHLLPQGVAGELCFAGIQVGLGYWRREEQTAKVFGDCPFVEQDEWGRKVRMYHTGDLCRWNADGQLEYISRIDTQVKLRGFRIELGEIENAILRFDGIRNAVAEVKEIGGLQHLCAYYTADAPIDEHALRESLAASLTDYMVPDAYLQMDSLPLTPNGKVNRKALPVPKIAAAEVTAFVEPEGETETDIAEAFRSVLGAERISANDDFFALGGTSISAIKVVAALTVKGYQLAFKDVFSCKTPRVLAAYLRGKADGAAGPAKEVITTGDGGDKAEERQSRYADILNANTLDALRSGERQPVGDVLLTGATGFMGIHFLRELIEREEGRIYCILRGKGSMSPVGRLRSLMFYYFDKSYEELFDRRIFVIEGDITDAAFFERLDVRVDTVINCAANVKHFSAGDDIEKVNVESVRNLTGWCLRHDARLVHTSTTSVAGQSVDGKPAADTQLTEFMFDFGQSLANQYVRSKYDAEQLILDAIRSEGLNAKIMRVATLSSRNSDGEFQINFRTNGFMGRLRTFAALGCVPFDMLDAPCEFSPIDEVCKASLLLATTPRQMVVFHPCNNHTLPLGDVLRCMDSVGVRIEPVEREAFDDRVRELMQDDSRSQVLQPLLAYAENNGHVVRYIGHQSLYTTQVLYRMGYHWPFTSWDYVERFISAINGFDFFS